MSAMPDKDSHTAAPADAAAGNWVDRRAPAWFRPYARLARFDRPIGAWLLMWPCWWGAALATPPGEVPALWLLMLFAIGAIVMRGAGCTYNDIVDRRIDARVVRTAGRPLPSGQVSVPQAFLFAGLLSLIGLAVLLSFNEATILLGLASLGFVAVYPFMKRVTYWPQIFLGLAFNWGALLGWTAVRGELAAPAVFLYAGGIAWTLGYDTIYAHQDKEDDVLVGVKSTALRFGAASGRWIGGFYISLVLALIAAGHLAKLSPLYWIGLLAVAGHLVWQLRTVDFDDPASCLRIFKSNHVTGAIVFAALVVGVWAS